MPSNFSGVWKLIRSDENFEEFLKEAGVSLLARKSAGTMVATQTIEQDGDIFRVKMSTSLKPLCLEFTVGAETEQESPMGGKVKVLGRWDGDKLVVKASPINAGNQKAHTVTREIVDGELVMTMVCGDVTTHRYWVKSS